MMGISMEIKDKGSRREESGDSRRRSTPGPPLQLPPRRWKWSGWWRRTAGRRQRRQRISRVHNRMIQKWTIMPFTLSPPTAKHLPCTVTQAVIGQEPWTRYLDMYKISRYVILHSEAWKWQKSAQAKQKLKERNAWQRCIIIVLSRDRWWNTGWHLNGSPANDSLSAWQQVVCGYRSLCR